MVKERKESITVGAAIAALQALQRLAAKEFRQGSAAEAYAVAKLTAVLTNHPTVVAVEKARFELVSKLGVKQGDNITVPPEKMQAFRAEYEPLAQKRVTVEYAPLALSSLNVVEGITPSDLIALRPFLDDTK